MKSVNDSTVILHQTALVNKLIFEMKDEIKSGRHFKTPGIPGRGIVRLLESDIRINMKKQQNFRSVVGTLLYLVKHSRPDICNSTREFCKVMDSGTDEDFKLMTRLVKYLKITKDLGIKLMTSMTIHDTWVLKSYVDSDFAGD